MKITIRKTMHADGTRAIFRGETIIGTIYGEKPTKANGRADYWGIAWCSGRFDWFGTYAEARDCALKG